MAAEESKIADKEQIEEEEEKQLWTDLPADLVYPAISTSPQKNNVYPAKLSDFTVLERFSPVPCLMFNNYTAKIHHPICNSTFGMDIQDFPPNDGSIRSSNYSWLLMTKSDEGIFFFNPFTNVKVELPPLLVGGLFPQCCFSFSAPPTCPDCTIFCIIACLVRKIRFCILQRGESDWTILEFDAGEDFEASSCNSLLYKGNYYCLSNEGDLVVYDVEKNEPRWIKSATSFLRHRLSSNRSKSFMVESDGELLAVFMSCDGAWLQVCKLDQSKMIWVPWFRGDKSLFYSLATRKYHSFGSSNSYTNLYESWRPSSRTCWIKPMTFRTCGYFCKLLVG